MATNADELSGGAPQGEGDNEKPTDDGQQPDTEGGAEDEGGADEGDQPQSVEDVASEMGWTPKDKYTGPPDQWKSAADFIRAGRDIQRGYASDLKALRGQIDTMAKTTADIMRDRLEDQRRELTERYNQQVDEGDAAGSYKTAQALTDLDRRASEPVNKGPSPEGMEFAERHKSWFNVDKAATARAIQICNDLAAQGTTDAAAQLRAAERIIRLEYPEHFEGQQNGMARDTRGQAQVHQPGGRSTSQGGRPKGFADMPREAQRVATDMFERGVIKSKDDYVKRYWQNQEGKQ